MVRENLRLYQRNKNEFNQSIDVPGITASEVYALSSFISISHENLATTDF